MLGLGALALSSLKIGGRNSTQVAEDELDLHARSSEPVSVNQVARLPLSPENLARLRETRKGLIQAFLDGYDKDTGLCRDRIPVNPPKDYKPEWNRFASLWATGLCFYAIALAVRDGTIARRKGEDMILKGLQTLADQPEKDGTAEAQGGWLPRFLNSETGTYARGVNGTPDTEFSSIDTALFFKEAFVVAAMMGQGSRIDRKVRQLFNRLDFRMMLTGGGEYPDSRIFSHGFHIRTQDGKPFAEFLHDKHHNRIGWGPDFSEGMLVPMMALGAVDETGKYAVPEEVWFKGWDRRSHWPGTSLDGTEKATLGNLPLFIYTILANGWGKDRHGIDFDELGKTAVELQQGFAAGNGYPAGLFGFTSTETRNGYHAGRATQEDHGNFIAPLVILASLLMNEDAALQGLNVLNQHGILNQGRYGMPGAWEFEAKPGEEFPADILMIDAGPALIALDEWLRKQDGRPGLYRKLMWRNPFMWTALRRAGFLPPWAAFPPQGVVSDVSWRNRGTSAFNQTESAKQL